MHAKEKDSGVDNAQRRALDNIKDVIVNSIENNSKKLCFVPL